MAANETAKAAQVAPAKDVGVTLDAAKVKILAAEVVRTGEKLLLPTGMSIPNAISVLQARDAYEKEEMAISRQINAFPWDGAVALHRVLTRIYGWAQAVPTPGFWGPNPPEMRSVDVGYNKTMLIPWGRFKLPNIAGFIQTTISKNLDGMVVFQLIASVKRESEDAVNTLFNEVARECREHSIYRGKAIRISFKNSQGEDHEIPVTQFMDTESISESQMVFSEEIDQQLLTSLFTPIERVSDCFANDIPVKRGVLLAGTYGTGKTLAASVAAKRAELNGITYLYVPRADELHLAIKFAKQYQSPACVVFCEDVDRVAAGDRSVSMDDLLNIIDGIDTKTANIITVLTTNDVESINAAMLRPGRLDAVIEVKEPDARAVEKLIRVYGGRVIPAHLDLKEVGELLAGQIPAVIAEVVKRAKLAQLHYQPRGLPLQVLSREALIAAARSMKTQTDLLKRAIEGEPKEKLPTVDLAIVHLMQKWWENNSDPEAAFEAERDIG